MTALDEWIEIQARRSTTGLLASISPLSLVKRRPGFGQVIRARPGAIVASPVLGDYDPDPDYFYHWFRDSALVIDALRLCRANGSIPAAPAHLADFVRFSHALARLSGPARLQAGHWREAVAPDHVRFLRSAEELRALDDDSIAGETRVNANGSLDVSRWARPQHDGPALRALALLRWSHDSEPDPKIEPLLVELVRSDLAYTRRHAREPCFDIWEEERALHYYTLRVGAAALEQGADWLALRGQLAEGESCRVEAGALYGLLDDFWSDEDGCYRSRLLPDGSRSPKALDIAVLLAAIHAGSERNTHSVRDPRQHATLRRLMAMFDAAYPINRHRPDNRAPAMGRYADDRYYSGGAYYFSTLGAAEFCYRAARAGAEPRAALIALGDAFLETVRLYTPASGELSEQFDQVSGVQTSAKQLCWSHAAFITCVDARRACHRRGISSAAEGASPVTDFRR